MFSSIEDKVFKAVGAKIVIAAEVDRKKADKEMIKRIDEFEKIVRDTAKSLIREEFDKRVREIVKEEMAKNEPKEDMP